MVTAIVNTTQKKDRKMDSRFHPETMKLIEARAGCGENRTSGSSGGRVSERNPSYPNQMGPVAADDRPVVQRLDQPQRRGQHGDGQ